MKRKLIKQGGGGFTFYVPKKWADKRGLKEGDSVEVEEKGDVLVVSSKDVKKTSANLSFSNEDGSFLLSSITHMYRLGYDRIKISASADMLDRVEKDVVPLLLGFEVTKRNKILILENISEPEAEKFDVMLRRCFRIILEMSADITSDLSYHKQQLDKLVFFCKRLIQKKSAAFTLPLIYWELLTYLLAIGHGFYYLSKDIKKIMPSAAISYYKSVCEYYELLYNAMYQKDSSLISKMNGLKRAVVFDRPAKLMKKCDPVIISRIAYIARIVQLCSGSVYYVLVSG